MLGIWGWLGMGAFTLIGAKHNQLAKANIWGFEWGHVCQLKYFATLLGCD